MPWFISVFPHQPLRAGPWPWLISVSKAPGVGQMLWSFTERDMCFERHTVVNYSELALTWPQDLACADETWRCPRVTFASSPCFISTWREEGDLYSARHNWCRVQRSMGDCVWACCPRSLHPFPRALMTANSYSSEFVYSPSFRKMVYLGHKLSLLCSLMNWVPDLLYRTLFHLTGICDTGKGPIERGHQPVGDW